MLVRPTTSEYGRIDVPIVCGSRFSTFRPLVDARVPRVTDTFFFTTDCLLNSVTLIMRSS